MITSDYIRRLKIPFGWVGVSAAVEAHKRFTFWTVIIVGHFGNGSLKQQLQCVQASLAKPKEDGEN